MQHTVHPEWPRAHRRESSGCKDAAIVSLSNLKKYHSISRDTVEQTVKYMRSSAVVTLIEKGTKREREQEREDWPGNHCVPDSPTVFNHSPRIWSSLSA